MSRDPWEGNSLKSQTLNQYNYVGGNPVNITDPSGYCYPPFEWLRDVGEAEVCSNLDLALVIHAHPNSTASQKAAAYAYILTWTTSHSALLLGGGILAGKATLAVAGTSVIVKGAVIGGATGGTIGGGAEYGTQALQTYGETQSIQQSLALPNKDWGRISVSTGVGVAAGATTGGTGNFTAVTFSNGLKGFATRTLINAGASAATNVVANSAQTGLQSCVSDGLTLAEGWQVSVEYAQEHGQRDLIVGGGASIIADTSATLLDPELLTGVRTNPYYHPVPDYRMHGGPAGTPLSSRIVGGQGLQVYQEIPSWYPSIRAFSVVAPDAVSNTGLLTRFADPLYEIYQQQQGGTSP